MATDDSSPGGYSTDEPGPRLSFSAKSETPTEGERQLHQRRPPAPAENSTEPSGGPQFTKGLTPERTKARENKIAKIRQRVVMSLVMIGVFLGIIWMGHPFLVGVVVVIQVGCFRELVNVRYKPAKERKAPLFRTMQWSMFWIAMMHTYGRSFSQLGLVHSTIRRLPEPWRNFFFEGLQYRSFLTFSGYITILVSFVLTLRKDILRYQIGNIIWTVGVLCLTVLQVQGAIVLIFSGIYWFILPCGLVVANDCFAYICGMSFGGRFTSATFLSISPNKTWEGFVGAILCTVVFAWVFSDIIRRFKWLTCPQHDLSLTEALDCEPSIAFVKHSIPIGVDEYTLFTIEAVSAQLHAVVLAVFASLVAPFGGFLASGIKRAYDIKDFGDLIPGHGGFMDRMDCQLMMLLCTYVYFETFVKDSEPSEGYILSLLDKLPKARKMRIMSVLADMLQTPQSAM